MFVKKRISSVKKLAILLLVFLFLGQNVTLVLAAEGVEAGSVPASETPASDNITPMPASDIHAGAVDATSKLVADEAAIIDSISTEKTDSTVDATPTVDSDKKASSAKSSDNLMSTMSSGTEPGETSPDETKKTADAKLRVETDSVTGGFIYTYPVTVPPGRNGLQPDLKLIYNNQQEENNANAFGYGWSVNIPYIERINRKGVETLFTQSFFNSSLTGELIRVGTSTSYGSKVDNGEFLKYQLIDNSYWQVTDKKGFQYIFGSSIDARQDNPASSTQIFKWMLEKVIDPNNNYVSYSYYKDNGQIYPDTIKYTGYNTTDGIFEVDFSRESRNDAATSTNTGFFVKTAYRINQIQAKINGTWVNQYQLGYQNGDNGVRSLLYSITGSGRDERGNTTSLPADSFNYQTKTKNWSQNTNISIPVSFLDANGYDNGVRLADVNGDGLMDIIQSRLNNFPYSASSAVYLNNGDGTGWQQDTNWVLPSVYFASVYVNDTGVRVADVNGDGLADILGPSGVYINNGTGWQQDTNISIPVSFLDSNSYDNGVRLVDVNGDGLVDIIHARLNNFPYPASSAVYLNNGDGTGWQQDTNWVLPSVYFASVYTIDTGVRVADVNGDGLADIFGPSGAVYINKGDGTGWRQDASMTLPTSFLDANGRDTGVRVTDVNGDGLADILEARINNFPYSASSVVYINKGDGTGWQQDANWSLPPVYFASVYVNDTGVRINDINGDNLVDIFGPSGSVYLANPKKADSLSIINNNKGAKVSVVYKNTPEYLSATSTLLNPKLPINLQTAYQIGVDDGQGNVATSTYSYVGGEYYYNNAYDKKFAGFNNTTKTDSTGNVTKNYYHQGSANSTTTGEYADHISKSGKAYRTENYDNASNLYSKTINKWDRSDLGDGRNFVKLVQSIDSTYDGDSTHKDKAKTFAHDNANGNKTQETNWGEVAGSDDGTFSDTGADLASTTITYAASTTPYIVGLPSQETTYDQNSNLVKDTKYYYDNLSFGNVDKGNLTKQENWKSGSIYVNSQKTYNSYGLVTQVRDPRGKNTNYTYDAYNLYVATSTNPLSQSTQYYYDYSNGQPKKTIDPNYRVFETVFDGLDRVIQENQPDIANPTATTTKAIYQYTDSSLPRCVKKTSYLSSAISNDAYTYLDGLDRTIQQRNQAEDNNNFSVKDSAYDKNGLLAKESLPYFSTGASSTAATATSSLYSFYLYDSLNRIKSAANTLGTTTYAYSDWKTTITDPLNHAKDLYKDAYNNLVKVDEHNSGNTYSTNYEYNLLGNLTKITDALSNIRNFNYDGLGRLLKSEDLHVSTDTTYGSSTLAYDDSGNLTTKINPNNQTVNYTYDDINRPLSEDYTGQSGTEVTYGYDNCTDGVGRLCAATTTAVITNYTYNALGLVKTEEKTIGTSTLTTQYDYDRQGNVSLLTYPDNGLVKYDYNHAGLLEKVAKKENGEQDYVDVISNLDYDPAGHIFYSLAGNGAQTYAYYDPNQLYRLEHKFTLLPDYGYDGSGIRTLTAPQVNTLSSLAPASDAARKFNNAMSKLAASVKSQKMKKSSGAAAFAQMNQPTGVKTLLWNNPPNQSTNMLTEGLWLTETMTNNDSFESGLDNWNSYSPNGGTFTADCSVAYSGSCSAKTVVATSSPNWWDSFISQQLRLDAGVNYTLKFKAKAATSTSIMMSVSQDHDPYYNLGLEKYINIGTTWKTYSYSFTSTATDLMARVMFGFGEHASSYWMDDVQLIPDNLNLLRNNSFENDFYNGWNFWSYGGDQQSTNAITCATSTEGDCSDFSDIHQAGESWQVQLHQLIAATSTNTYVLTFYAKATSSRVIHPAIVMNHDPWSDLTPWKDIAITTSWAKYSVELTPSATDANARLMFYLGDYAPGVYIDNVHLWVKQNTKLTTSQPNFSAIYADNDTSDTAPYYQLQLIEKRGSFSTPLWDSGKTAMTSTAVGNRTPNITYGGPAISAWDGKIYYWRLKLWDNSDAEGPWTNGRDYFQMYGNAVQDLNYHYDAVGNITQIQDKSYTNAAKVMDYTYDDLNRLITASSTIADNNQNYRQTYSYNAIGNLLNKSDIGDYTYNGYQGANYANPHAATTINGTASTYDNAGNLTSDGIWTNAWNYNNWLTSSTNGTTTVIYAYDQSGNRVSYSANNATTTTANKYYQTTGATSTKYIYAGNSFVATLEKTANGTDTYYNHNDHLSGSNVISNASSTLVELLDYYPYGGIRLDEKQGTFNEKKKFTGHEYDADTGLNYMGARYQDGNIGRFVSEDPLVNDLGINNEEFKNRHQKTLNEVLIDPQSLNSYSYALNNPLKYVDPTGKSATLYVRPGGLITGISASLSLNPLNWMGHATINVNGQYYGFAPTSKDPISDVQNYSQSTFESDYKGNLFESFGLNTTPEQDQKIVDYYKSFDGKQKEGGANEYDVQTNNTCVTKARGALESAGVTQGSKILSIPSITPNMLANQFKAYNIIEKVSNFINGGGNNLVNSINQGRVVDSKNKK